MFIKRLTRQGNSAALIIDKQILDLLDITQETDLKITVKGRQLIVEPLSAAELEQRFDASLRRIGKKHAVAFKRLAK